MYRLRVGVVAAAALLASGPARAQPRTPVPTSSAAPSDAQAAAPPPAPGAAALDRAKAAWEKGDYDVAEPLYREAIETGGLSPTDVLDAYVHLGATRSVLGKKTAALAAFKTASLIDPHFLVPPEAGKRAILAANKARQAESRLGGIQLDATFPSDIASGESAQVDVTLDAAHTVFANKLALFAHDPLTGKTYTDAEDAASSVHFKIPASLTLPSATLVLRVDALDAHQNRLASIDGKVHVKGSPVVAALPVGAAAGGALGVGLGASSAKAPSKADEKKGGGFWHTAWPYVIGGAALAAGGAAIYFATRPSDEANVGAVRVDLTK